jgi:NADPH:quinone reductase-like Zn-dependent oxidoreductase
MVRAEAASHWATTVPIWRSYPLPQAARAHADLEARRNHGKIVLLP